MLWGTLSSTDGILWVGTGAGSYVEYGSEWAVLALGWEIGGSLAEATAVVAV